MHLAGCRPPAPTVAWDPGPRREGSRRAGTPERGGSSPQATQPERRTVGVAEEQRVSVLSIPSCVRSWRLDKEILNF